MLGKGHIHTPPAACLRSSLFEPNTGKGALKNFSCRRRLALNVPASPGPRDLPCWAIPLSR